MKDDQEYFVFGIEELEQTFRGILEPPSTIVVAGHPGAGKTTLAITICYSNAKRGYPCLYVTFQEEKAKLYRNMKNLGIDLEDVEKKGAFKFVKLPITQSVESVSEFIIKLIEEYKPRIVVIDSINSMLESLKTKVEIRGWLQNFYYAIANAVNGLIILIVELPFGEERIELGAIEFIADAILVLKHRIENRLIARTLEIRKVRGSPLNIAEIPFSITSGKGIEVYMPKIIEELPREGKELVMPCAALQKALDHIHLGMHIYVTYPPDSRIPTHAILLAGILLTNKLKTLVISYTYPPDTIRSILKIQLMKIGINPNIVDEVLDKYIIFRGFNPFSMSLDTLAMREISLIEEHRDVQAITFHGVELPALILPPNRYLSALYNQLLYFKAEQKLVIRTGAYINSELHAINSALSDAVLRVEVDIRNEGEVYERIHIWRRNRNPYILTNEEIKTCMDEIKERIKKIL
ncbi:MAG: ATPase domain-containing protein [Thermoprotei archaeon]